MADNTDVSLLLNQPKTISQMILTRYFPTNLLLQYLLIVPNALNTAEALTELCRCEYETIFQYLLSLPFTHSHRHFMLSCLRPRIMCMKVDDIKRLSIWIPNLSALWYNQDTRE